MTHVCIYVHIYINMENDMWVCARACTYIYVLALCVWMGQVRAYVFKHGSKSQNRPTAHGIEIDYISRIGHFVSVISEPIKKNFKNNLKQLIIRSILIFF